MTLFINASVGRRGVNKHDDTTGVQKAINQVPLDDGGSPVPLKPDGICGRKTIDAIERFQIHHFGWPGADGLIEPGRQTYNRLVLYTFPDLELPPIPKRRAEPRSTKFIIMRENARDSFGASNHDYYFEVRSVPHNFASVYYLERRPMPKPRPIPTKFNGHFSIFHTKKPITTKEFQCQAVYFSREQVAQKVESHLTLVLDSGSIEIPMDSHLIGPHGIVRHSQGGASTFQSGLFDFVSLADQVF
ncbi:peptidoglycan-binding protein [Stieleria sp. JC731]|uniref:peptidoglycan-binding domain-containing protein n=1 Tax=Pirellulaceae TaxID=2691357 RepID=UPI001E594B58|nr:peptidoglycan-binding domain-containing protein [Stieleria sp. JC731]MCC9600408.1 peptidoglycan-binding protein [Stieleria sp. JC731]